MRFVWVLLAVASANAGQANASLVYIAQGPQYTCLLEADGSARYEFPAASHADPLRVQFPGRQPAAAVDGEQAVAGVTRYYRGDVQRENRNFERVRFRGIYPGIDLLWQGREGDLEYDFLVAPKADPRQIQVRFAGARRVFMDAGGDLLIAASAGTIRQHRPVAWQEIGGIRRNVPIAVKLREDTVHFVVGRYDRHFPLRIDPVLSYSTYLGGAGYDAAYAIAADGAGGIYVTGTTGSLGFPAQGSGVNNSDQAFVTKFDASGNLIYTTVLAGSAYTCGQAIAVDSAGNAYIAGTTEASDFPATKGAWQPVFGGIADAFAAKLNPQGQLIYATYIGGAGQEAGTGIAIDSSGNAYISGYTSSAFPTTSGAAQTVYGGGFADAFVVKLNPAGSAAVYSTLLGSTGNDEAEAIAVDGSGHACIAGYTDSANLKTIAALQPVYGGEGDVLIACLNAGGSAWTTVSYLGGSNFDQAYALAIDGGGNLYVSGTTFSTDFPVTAGVFQSTKTGSYDAFLARLSPGGSAIQYSTYLGGTGSDAATALAIGGGGDVWIGGYTTSTDFPVSASWQSSATGSFDGFVSHLNSSFATLLTSSYLGGSSDDRVMGIALDAAGLVWIAGFTQSNNFPVTPGAIQGAAPAGVNAFLSTISPSAYSISGQVTAAGAPLSGVEVTLGGAGSASSISDANGNFLFNNLQGGCNYTLTASLSGYIFSPASLSFNSLSSNSTANFTANTAYSISGAITLSGAPLPGVVIIVTGASVAPAKSDSTGSYAITGLPAGGNYTIAPSLAGYSFSPASQSFTGLNSNQSLNFTAVAAPLPGTTQVIWQDPVSGFSQTWYLGGAQGASFMSASTITTKNVWRIAAVADFNGDGYPDIVWQDPKTGASQIWFLGGPQGTTLLEAVNIGASNSWQIVAAADFNLDGHPDLVWQDPVSGWAQIWYLGGPLGITVQSAANLTLRNPWNIVGSGDFNGDGHPDLLWQDPISGTVQIWYLTGLLGNELLSAANLTASTSDVVAVADFNRDGHPDIVWQDPKTGVSQIWLLGGSEGMTQLGTAALSGANSWRIVGPR